jgi:hypothetical protein
MRIRILFIPFIWLALVVSNVQAQLQAIVFVPEAATVRGGPGTMYDRLGELTIEQTAPALGRSAQSDWIEIEFVSAGSNRGWVYAPFVELRGTTIEALPMVETPPTPTLPPTPEGEPNPFITVTVAPASLPTFTPAPTVEIPHYTEAEASRPAFPPAALVLVFLAVTVVGVVMAVIRRKV